MINHDVLPTPESWATGEAQRYGWRHIVNSDGVYGAYGYMRIANRAIPTKTTQNRVTIIKELLEAEGSVLLPNGVIEGCDVVVGNALKSDGQISTNQEAWDVGLKVGLFVLAPSIEIESAAQSS